ncbi:hypothetical protein [Actinomadura sp. 6N118]|uniref:hypothetical protein n=1 Tax=Actinomadura sp. 6N118 TaxID=3375151 RepID=UPI0037887F3A
MAPPYPFNIEIFVSADIRAPDLAELAARLRSEWPGHDRATAPADRPAAEAAIMGLYRLIGAARSARGTGGGVPARRPVSPSHRSHPR